LHLRNVSKSSWLEMTLYLKVSPWDSKI
jgi:hypothetical protein